MTDVVCGGCLSRQAAGTQYCGVCGREFPRTGRPVTEQQPGPQSAVQQMAGSGYGAAQGGQDLPYHHGGSRIDDEFHTGTFVPVRDPGPAPAAPEPVYAHVGRRIVALMLDSFVGGLLYGAFAVTMVMVAAAQIPEGAISVDENTQLRMAQLSLAGTAGGAALLFLWGLAMVIWEGKTGKTLGNLAFGIRTLSAENQEPIGFWRVVLRNLVVGAGSIVPLVGQLIVLLSPLWDDGGRKQGWHDKAARAVVVDIKKKPAPVVEGFDPDSRPRAPDRVVAQQGAGPGSAAPGAAAFGTPAPAFEPTQQPGPPAPTAFPPGGSPAPAHPAQAQPAPAQPDPWAFPGTSGPPSDDGLITDVPPTGTGPFSPMQPGHRQEPSTQQWPADQLSNQSQQPMLPGAPPSSPPEAGPPATVSTSAPPATPNSPRPITAANTIPEHPVLETSPYPPIAQPRRRDSQPTRAVGPGGPGQGADGAGQGTGYGQMPQGQYGSGLDQASAEQLPDQTMMQRPTGSSGAMDPPPVVGAVLELDSGERVSVEGPTLVGRNPQAPGSSGVQLIQLPDPTRSVSKNHAELGVDSAGLWLTDRNSTNGTVVSVPGLPPRVAEAGARVRVPVGSTIHFGDRRVVVHPGAGQG